MTQQINARPTTAIAAAAMLLSGGCANLQPRDPGAVATTITAADTEIRAILSCLGKQLDAYFPHGPSPIVIGVDRFTHKGMTYAYSPASLPLDATSMVEATLNRVGPMLTYAPIYRNRYQVETDSITPTVLNLSGGIEVQEAATVDNKSIDIAFSIYGWSMQFSNKNQGGISRIQFTLNATLPNGTSFHGLSAPITVTFDRAEGDQYTAAASSAEIALGGEIISRRVNSYGDALRLGLAHSVATLIGRWRAIPYYFCTGGQEDPIVANERRERWHEIMKQDPKAAYAYLQDLLRYNGYPVETTGGLDAPTTAALGHFFAARQKAFNMNALDSAAWELFQGIAAQPTAVLREARAEDQRSAE